MVDWPARGSVAMKGMAEGNRGATDGATDS